MKKTAIPVIDIKKYGGKQIALLRGRVVASGHRTIEVLNQARRRVSPEDHGEIWLFMVPKGLTVIYRT